MGFSLLKFAREFERLKSHLAADIADDTRLILVLDFWPELEQVLDKSAYQSYRQEYVQFVDSYLNAASLKDLPPEKLHRLLSITAALSLPEKGALVKYRLAQVYCYVSDFKAALAVLLASEREAGNFAELVHDIESLRDCEGLEILCDQLKSAGSPTHAVMRDILDSWTSLSEELSHDNAYCLFVEDGGRAETRFGRLRPLKGVVELSGTSAGADEITFENQIKAPDDPFVGSSYNAFNALREFFGTHGFKEKGTRFYHSHFNIVDSGQTFTGDSIGLGLAAVTFAGLMKTEIMRQERFVSQEVAFTGGVSENGEITPVNEETLRQKLERTFFSHIRYLVLPKENLRVAEDILAGLANSYPKRTLHLVAYERLEDVLEDKNVLRSEKVCIGQYVVRKVAHYKRTTTALMPLLLVLIYLLISVIHPKAWIWFDDDPQYVRKTRTGFVALNADSVALWEKEFGCDSLLALRSEVGDLDGDGRNEVAVMPHTNAACSCNVMLFMYNGQGDLLFRVDCVIVGEYPGDSTRFQSHTPRALRFIRYEDAVVILTSLTQDDPSRTHIKLWNPTGELRGWYVGAGSNKCWPRFNSNGTCEELLFYGENNRVRSACVFVLPWDSLSGAAPPYSDSSYDLTWVKRGNQLKYVIFQQTDYNRATNWLYSGVHRLDSEGNGTIKVTVVEGGHDERCTIAYQLDSNLRVIDVTCSDVFMDFRSDYVDDGKLPPVEDWADYLAKLRDSVKYWTDSGWVSEGALRASEYAQ